VTLARERHFARAAEACNIAQPTLSAAIHKLEEDLQARLVIRGHRFVGLTPEGERVLAWGRQILTDYSSLREDLSSLRQGLVGVLRLGVIPAAMPLMSFLTARFCEAHPLADVDVRSMTSRAIQKSLDDFEIDGSLTYLENEPLENVQRVPLYEERYVFVTGRSQPFAARKTVTWGEAARRLRRGGRHRVAGDRNPLRHRPLHRAAEGRGAVLGLSAPRGRCSRGASRHRPAGSRP
jgi:DNA-binding transcriptional LysR family regulator